MKVHYSYVKKPRQFKVILRCVNCDRYANTEDIKFGCANCEQIIHSGEFPTGFKIIHPEGGFYKIE